MVTINLNHLFLLTKFTYTTDASKNCSGEYGEDPITYDESSAVGGIGSLYDFNCIGTNNVMAYKLYLGGCPEDDGLEAGTGWAVTDICYYYNNVSNISDPNYGDEYVKLYQRLRYFHLIK